MVFVPSLKVQKLFNQKLHTSDEYKRQYNMDLQDPSNWQPLDPARNFAQYQQFNFGRSSVMLRVVEETPTYKAQNLRYKLFEEEQTKLTYQERDEPKTCYGWAKYTHETDSTSEWRQAFISRTEAKEKPWLAAWIFAPQDKNAVPGLDRKEAKDRREVLLHPRLPKMDDQVTPEHEEILKQAVILRISGKSDWEIEGVLNQVLREQASKDNQGGTASVAPITVDEIRAYCMREEAKQASAQANK